MSKRRAGLHTAPGTHLRAPGCAAITFSGQGCVSMGDAPAWLRTRGAAQHASSDRKGASRLNAIWVSLPQSPTAHPSPPPPLPNRQAL